MDLIAERPRPKFDSKQADIFAFWLGFRCFFAVFAEIPIFFAFSELWPEFNPTLCAIPFAAVVAYRQDDTRIHEFASARWSRQS